MIKKDKNPLRIFATILLVALCGVSFYLAIFHDWSIPTAFNFVGIVCNLVGALWIASGVYIFSVDKNHLEKVNPNKGKYSKKIAELMSEASRTIPLGVLYILIGSGYQLFVVVGTELNWF